MDYFSSLDSFLGGYPEADVRVHLAAHKKRMRASEEEADASAAATVGRSSSSSSKCPQNESTSPDQASQSFSPSKGGEAGADASTRKIVPLPDLSRNGWAERNKSKWQCQQQVAHQAPATNLFLADKLEELSEACASAPCDHVAPARRAARPSAAH